MLQKLAIFIQFSPKDIEFQAQTSDSQHFMAIFLVLQKLFRKTGLLTRGRSLITYHIAPVAKRYNVMNIQNVTIISEHIMTE